MPYASKYNVESKLYRQRGYTGWEKGQRKQTDGIIFKENTPITDTKEKLLSNLANKERFISQLVHAFQNEEIETITANDDADTLIIQTAIRKSFESETIVVVGQDVDLLTLSISLTPTEKDIRLLREAQSTIKARNYSSKDLQMSNVLKNSRETVLFAHAYSGSDTTSAFFGNGKLQTTNLSNSNPNLREVVETSNKPNSTNQEITEAGDKFTLALYKAYNNESSINHQRYVLFNTSVGNSSHTVTLAKLPPTFATLQKHSLRAYHQIQAWRGHVLQPEEWGWKK